MIQFKSTFRTGAMLAAILTLGMYGCSSSGTGSAEKPDGATPSESAKKYDPATAEGKIEVAAFKGGYDIDAYQQAATEFTKDHPKVSINVWGNPRVWEQLRPRFISGDVPDLAFPGWGMDHWALAEEDQLEDLGPALDSPSYEGDQTWRSTFDENTLKLGQLEGKQYMLPYYVMLHGWWYDANLFQKKGWTVPKTYEELLTLSEKIKASGMAPITFQGKYPYYMIQGMLLPWCLSEGGIEAVNAAQNLEKGAWNSPAMLKAATMIDELNRKGYFERGAVSLSHTDSQTDFLNGKAAMIPCGTWLYSEMKSLMPKDVKLNFFLTPPLAAGKGDPTAIMVAIEPWMVPSAAKNKDAAIEFFKYMTSAEVSKRFVQEKGTLMAIKSANEGELPEVLKTPAKVFRESKTVWSLQYRQWYPAFHTKVENALTSMLNLELTPQQFCDLVEEKAQETANDPNITKHKVQ